MTAIVMNTATGAVSEYGWTFASISAKHAADANGLYPLGGDTDNGTAITGEIRGGKTGGEKQQSVGSVYLTMSGVGGGTLIVQGRTSEWEYPVTARGSGVGVARPGRGIRETWLAFGYRNASGTAFRLDRIDADVLESKTRRS